MFKAKLKSVKLHKKEENIKGKSKINAE